MARRPHSPVLLLLACALFLRLWVPAGWMPAANGALFAIEPCPAAQPMVTAHGMHDHGSSDHHGDHKAGHDGDCSFAPHHGGLAQLASTPVPAEPLAATERPAQPGTPAFFATGPPAFLPPATGPPALA